jgi:protein-S-isoprenylcysteine O-methyltransferase Ste14
MAARLSPLKLLSAALNLAVWPALVLAIGGWRWPEGWVFALWFLAFCTHTLVWLYRHDRALLLERYKRLGSGGQSRGDAILVVLAVLGFVAWLALMPLDARRFHWSPPLPIAVKIFGGVLLMPAWFFFFRAFRDNTFASALVRVQAERGHHVISTGVYGIVRHPMYLGGMLMATGGSLLTGSLAALAAAVAMSLLLAGRAVEEERLLARELPGYEEYRRRVRSRLIPYVW